MSKSAASKSAGREAKAAKARERRARKKAAPAASAAPVTVEAAVEPRDGEAVTADLAADVPATTEPNGEPPTLAPWIAALPDPGLLATAKGLRRKNWAVYPVDFQQPPGRIGAAAAKYLKLHAAKPYQAEPPIAWMVTYARAAWSKALSETGVREV